MSTKNKIDVMPPATSHEVRERLIEALRLDFVGPGAGHALAEERLPGWVRPSNFDLTEFLVPTGTPLPTSAPTSSIPEPVSSSVQVMHRSAS